MHIYVAYVCMYVAQTKTIIHVNNPVPTLTYKLDMLYAPNPRHSNEPHVCCFFIKLIYSSLETDLSAVFFQ